MRYWVVSLVLVVLGIAGITYGVPLHPVPDPAVAETSFPGTYGSPGVVTVEKPGAYTVWEDGPYSHRSIRCRVSGPGGESVRLTAPRFLVRWETDDSDAVDNRTALGTFDAPRAGRYGLDCPFDTEVPGVGFVVTEEPDLTRSLAATVGGAVALLAGAAVAVTAFVRRRRVAVPRNGGPSS
ncbi:hypothetical protein [Virgisporangium ochraceum]|uniref:Uncharacterized protein n=1 Tax=Virgisporangium ochraceum TaxID=65505 RepID=A0A8J4A173_9ACTN|nr:hypothetical protein [Virgisporangium ochraceum]GIJ73892.1 hypothetical protein Voc01_088090 [Virgisporangium ochraceum]